MDLEEADDKGISSLIETGSQITGSALAAAAAGYLLVGPPGAAIGAGAAPLLARAINTIGNDVAERYLSERERARIGGVIIYAKYKIKKNLEAGGLPRSDFGEMSARQHPACAEITFVDRPSAEEIIEGVLLAAQREHEEKKVIFFGNLLANIAFNQKITRPQANSLIRKAKDVSFRQMCLISLFAQSENFRLRNHGYIGETALSFDAYTLLQEIYELTPLGLLTLPGITLRSIADITPKKMRVEGIGRLLYNMMELKNIDTKDLETLEQLLR